MTEPVRLALLGCGIWGKKLLRTGLNLGAKVWVVDPSAEAREKALAEGAAGAVHEVSRLPMVEAFVVATPASTHFDVLSILIDRDEPIFVEKPFTLDFSEAEELARRCGDRIFVLHTWRYHPAVRSMREFFREGTLGPIRWLRTTRTNWTSPRRDCDPIWTLQPHDLSIILEITGNLPPVSFAQAETSSGVPCGLIARLDGEFPCITEVSTRYADTRREIRLHGDDGVAQFNGEDLLIHRGDQKSPEPSTTKIPLTEQSALENEVASLLRYLRDDGPAPVSAIDDAILIARRMHEIRTLAGI